METLTQSQIESIKKFGTARVISKLLNVGYSEEELVVPYLSCGVNV